MGPTKRKGSVRRPVIDINNQEDSPSRPSWQNKYQQMVSGETMQNGDSQSGSSEMISSTTSSLKPNPLSGLLSTYNSDSDSEPEPVNSLDSKVEDFFKEIQAIAPVNAGQPSNSSKVATKAKNKPTAATAWQQCIDQASGYPYYWNTQSNDVTWEMPAELKAAVVSAVKNVKKEKVVKKPAPPKKKKYPWEGSDSEDEKIEMITSFGPQSGDESEEEKPTGRSRGKGKDGGGSEIGPHLPGSSREVDDTEAEPLQAYETSSLMTHYIQDKGPPGDEGFVLAKEIVSSSQAVAAPDPAAPDPAVPDSSEVAPPVEETPAPEESPVVTESEVNGEQVEEVSGPEEPTEAANADDIIALIEKETPPDYKEEPEGSAETKPNSFALIAGYGEDSEPEDGPTSAVEKGKEAKPLFPIADFKPLFPCVEPPVEVPPSAPPSLLPDSSLPDSTTSHKAFKRKKRIELDAAVPGPSTSKVLDGPVQYSADPAGSDHRGLGFGGGDHAAETKRTFNFGIQFIKAETLKPSHSQEADRLLENGTCERGEPEKGKAKEVSDEEIENAASLLKEKVVFLAEGNKEVSPVQRMAIQLETLVSAWQHGALTPSYLSRWLRSTHADLAEHEKSAAPPGWACTWDRKMKRYIYRNTATKALVWEYPVVEGNGDGAARAQSDDGGGDEMELCNTPPPHSPLPSPKLPVDHPLTPPPPVISDTVDPMPQPPPPPQITFTPEPDATPGKKRKRKAEEVSSSSEGDADSKTAVPPPLPPLPPLPPPPDDPPPPPPSPPPPPLPIDPDQPLPPGVDEPEYSLMRPSVKRTLPHVDSSTFPAEALVYGAYGMVSSSSHVQHVQAAEYSGYDPGWQQPDHAAPQVLLHRTTKKAKPSLATELDSFYSDIAMLDTAGADSSEQQPGPAPAAQPQPPAPAPSQVATAHSSRAIESTSTSNELVKKKKKTKLTPGLSMKKKGVSSLVAKWQQVQQEVRRDYDDEEEDDVSSTHK